MKQSALAMHLLVCGGDLMFPARSISFFSPSASYFPFVLAIIFSILPFAPSLLHLLCVYVHLPIWVCDSCSLFVCILSALHIYRAERFKLNLTLNASPSFPIVLPSFLFFLVLIFRWTFSTHTMKARVNKTRSQQEDKCTTDKKTQTSLAGKEK